MSSSEAFLRGERHVHAADRRNCGTEQRAKSLLWFRAQVCWSRRDNLPSEKRQQLVIRRRCVGPRDEHYLIPDVLTCMWLATQNRANHPLKHAKTPKPRFFQSLRTLLGAERRSVGVSVAVLRVTRRLLLQSRATTNYIPGQKTVCLSRLSSDRLRPRRADRPRSAD